MQYHGHVEHQDESNGAGGFKQPHPPQYPTTAHSNTHSYPVQQQPMGQEKMSIQNGVNSRNAKNSKRGWNHGLCSCCGDCGGCSCCLYGKTRSKYKGLETTGPVDGSNCNGSCLCFFLLNFIQCQCIVLAKERKALKLRYNIAGGGCGNCLAAWCCQCCVQVQHLREIKDEEDYIGIGH
ncbi:hypothetical protein RQP46_001037 [Phenoliferia psychrophenolica]